MGTVGPYAAAAALGYLLGTLAVHALVAVPGGSSSTPLARVGFVLRDAPSAPSASWSALSAYVEAVRSSLVSPEREAFDLVAAVHGLHNGGNGDWELAERICRGLGWSRCDRTALERLKELTRP